MGVIGPRFLMHSVNQPTLVQKLLPSDAVFCPVKDKTALVVYSVVTVYIRYLKKLIMEPKQNQMPNSTATKT